MMWEIQQDTVRLSLPDLGAVLQLRYPERGLREVICQETSLTSAALLGVLLPGGTVDGGENLLESYVRGEDLIARYEETPARPLESLIYWRTIVETGICGVEVIVSQQTELLDSEAGLRTVTQFPASEMLCLVDATAPRFEQIEPTGGKHDTDKCAGLFLLRPADVSFSYVEMIHPVDFGGATLSTDGSSIRIESTLFTGQHLEKGVIRRGRLRGIFVDRENDQSLALAHYRQLSASPPPLTA